MMNYELGIRIKTQKSKLKTQKYNLKLKKFSILQFYNFQSISNSQF